MYRKIVVVITFCCASLCSSNALADSVAIQNTFTAGTPAVAADVNENFSDVASAINDNDARIVYLENQNAELTARIVALENTLNQLNSVMSLQTDAQGHPAVVFSRVNVHIVNGEGNSNTINGTGNLIVGYNEINSSPTPVCSLGSFENETDCVQSGGAWEYDHKSGSHNVVIGPEHRYSQYGGLIAGLRNTVNGANSTVSGGLGNFASGNISSVSGGVVNRAYGVQSSITGGGSNRTTGLNSSISGGSSNQASGGNSHISGGESNIASGSRSSVSGGWINITSGLHSSVSGGSRNEASAETSNVCGGTANKALGGGSVVSGGFNRSAVGINDWVAGSLFQDQ